MGEEANSLHNIVDLFWDNDEGDNKWSWPDDDNELLESIFWESRSLIWSPLAMPLDETNDDDDVVAVKDAIGPDAIVEVGDCFEDDEFAIKNERSLFEWWSTTSLIIIPVLVVVSPTFPFNKAKSAVHGLGTLGSNFIRICGILVGAAGDVELGLVDNETELCEEVDFDISKWFLGAPFVRPR